MSKIKTGRRSVPLNPLTLGFADVEREARFRQTHNQQVLRQTRLSLLLGALIYLILGIEDPWFFPADYLWIWGVRLMAVVWLGAALILSFQGTVRKYLQVLLAVIAIGAGIGPLVMLLRGGSPLLEAYAVGSLMVIVWAYTLAGLRFVPALIANLVLAACTILVYWGWLDVALYRAGSATLHLLMISILAGAAGYMIETNWRRLFVRTEWLDAELQSHAHQALHDALTGLPNRHCMHIRLDEALGRARRNGQPFSLLFIDLNDFKPVNDLYGHRVGDQVLIELAVRLRGIVREVDMVARLGGDEFVVLAEGLTAAHAAEHLAPKVLDELSRGIAVTTESGPRILRITGSIGIACYPMHGTEPRQLLQNADLAMYRAKAIKAAGGGIAAHEPQADDAAAVSVPGRR